MFIDLHPAIKNEALKVQPQVDHLGTPTPTSIFASPTPTPTPLHPQLHGKPIGGLLSVY